MLDEAGTAFGECHAQLMKEEAENAEQSDSGGNSGAST
jgi:hypothetical protein